MMSDLLDPPFLIAILVALTVHEFAHAFVADRLGDPTARNEGRLTLNPIAHLDPMGTLMFFLVHFGWGKPVPIDPRYFKHFKRDTALVAIAGPLSNLILAVLSFIGLAILAPQVLHAVSGEELLVLNGAGGRIIAFIVEVLGQSLFLNLGLMAFNLIPIAPLDGSKIIHPFIPLRYETVYERFLDQGPMILIVLLVLERALNMPIFVAWISFVIDVVLRALTSFL